MSSATSPQQAGHTLQRECREVSWVDLERLNRAIFLGDDAFQATCIFGRFAVDLLQVVRVALARIHGPLAHLIRVAAPT